VELPTPTPLRQAQGRLSGQPRRMPALHWPLNPRLMMNDFHAMLRKTLAFQDGLC
jgi:hypothetical protein